MALVPRWLRRGRGLRVAQVGLVLFCIMVLGPMFFGGTPSGSSSSSRAKRADVVGSGSKADQIRQEKQDDPSAEYRGRPKKDWHDYKEMETDAKRKGVGEGGQPVKLPDDEETKKKQDALYRVNGFDAMASDLISVERSVKDVRHPNCRKKTYIDKLPTVAVIFPSHNEHNTTLLRSIYSIINRSPKEVLREIIVVDDFGTKDFLKKPLEDYLKEHKIDDIVKIVRTTKREGLIRARQIGAQAATADVMVFLDSHSEANYNWLPPLLEPIALDYKTVVCPFVDVVDCDNFEYKPQVKARLAHAVQQQQQQQQLNQESPVVQQHNNDVNRRHSSLEESAGVFNNNVNRRHSSLEESAGVVNNNDVNRRHSSLEESAGVFDNNVNRRHSSLEESAGVVNNNDVNRRHSSLEESAGVFDNNVNRRHSSLEESAGVVNNNYVNRRHSSLEESAGVFNDNVNRRHSILEERAGVFNYTNHHDSKREFQKAGQMQPSQMGGVSQRANEFNGDKPVRQPSQMGGVSQGANEFMCDRPVRQPSQMGGVSQRVTEFNCDEPAKQPAQKTRLSQSDDEFIWDEPFGQLLQRSTALMRELNPEGGQQRQQRQRRQVQPSQMGGLSQSDNKFICDKPVSQPSQRGGLSQSDNIFICDKPVSQPSQMGGLSQSDNIFICDKPVSQPPQMGGLSQSDNVFICDSPVRQSSQRRGVSQREDELICDKPVSQPAQTGRLAQSDKLLIDDKPVNQRSQMSVVSKYDANTHWEQHQQRHVSGERSQRGTQETWADREVPSQRGGRSQTDNVRICDRPVGQPSQMSHVARYEQKYEEAQQQHQHQFKGAEHTEEEGAVAARYTRMKANASNRGATSRQYIREECREYQRQQEGYRTESWNMPGRTQERHAPAYEYPDVGYNKYDDHQVKWADGTSRGGGDDGERTKHQGIHRGYERVRLCGGTEVRGGADKLEETDNRFGWQETMGKMMDVWQKANEKQIEVWQRSSEKQVLATVRHDQFSGEDKAEFKYWFEDLLGRMEETCLTDDEKLRHLVGCLKGNAKRQFREDNVRPTWRAALQYLSEKYGNRYEKRSKEADRFHTRMQKSGESIREYAFALKRLCPIDEMNSYYEEYMTGQLIIGLQSARDREKATYEFEIKRASFANIVKGIEDYEYCRDKVSSRGSQAVKPSQRGAGTEQWERGREQTRGGAVKYEHTQQQSANQRQTYQPPANNNMRHGQYQVDTQQPPPGFSWNRKQDSNQQQRVNQVQWSGLRQPVQDYQQKQRLSGGRECFKCGEVGHLQSSCSNEDQGQMAGERPPQSFGHQAVRTVSVAKPVEDVEAVSAELRALKDEIAQLKHRDEFRYGMLSAKVHKMLMNDGIEKENESEKKEATVRAVSVPIQSFNAQAQQEEDYPIRVNGQPVGLKHVLFDTGAQMNLISQNFAAQLGVKIQPCNTPLVAVNLTTVVCAGVCTVELKIDEKMTVIECHVATESNTPMLVGTKAMQTQGIQLLSSTGRSLMASVIPAEGDVLDVRVPLVVAEKPEDENGVISVSTEHDEEVKPATENVVESSETSNGELATGQDMNKWFSVPSEQYSQLKLMLPELLQQPAGELSRVTVSDPVIKLVQNRMEHGQMKLKPEFQRDVKGIIVKTGHCLGQIHSRMKAAVSKVFVVSRKLVQKLF